MGQYVGVFDNIRQRDSRKIRSTDNISSKGVLQKDVTQTYMNSNPSNSNALSMSTSSHNEQEQQQQHESTKSKVKSHFVTEYTSKIASKEGWTGYRLTHLTKGQHISNNNTRLVRSPGLLHRDDNKKMNTIYATTSTALNDHHHSTTTTTTTTTTAQISDDIEQLITMMKNHRVSDDITLSPTFDFNFSNSKNKLLTPQHSPPTPKMNSLPEFKFSFPAHKSLPESSSKHYTTTSTTDNLKVSLNTSPDVTMVSPKATQPFPNDKSPKVSIVHSNDNITSQPSTKERYHNQDCPQQQQQQNDETDEVKKRLLLQQKKNYEARLSARKILPLPKPRIQRSKENLINIPSSTSSTQKNNIVFHNPTNTNTTTTTATTSSDSTSPDHNKKKMKCSEDNRKPIDNNKRKERNWNETTITARLEITATPIIVETSTTTQQQSLSPPVPKLAINNTITTKKSEKKPIATATTTMGKKKGSGSKQQHNENIPTTTSSKKKKYKNKKNSYNNNEDMMAPGGFLSSDITLFDNPISDDWICLFCQYDILFSGYKETKKKNYHRRKKGKKPSKKGAVVVSHNNNGCSDTVSSSSTDDGNNLL